MELLRIANWQGSYHGIQLGNLSFTLHQGENLALVGKEGKTEVIRGIMGLVPPQYGEIFWRKSLLGEEEREEMAEEMAVVLGDAFYPVGLRPVDMARIFRGCYGSFSTAFFINYLAMLNLSPNLPMIRPQDRFKCALAVALARRPQILLYDPPIFDISQEKQEEQVQWDSCFQQCSRVLVGELCAKICTAPSVALLPWKDWDTIVPIEKGEGVE